MHLLLEDSVSSAPQDFGLKIDSPNKIVKVRERFFKMRCFKNWRKAIKYFEFEVEVSGEYFISLENATNLEVKKSQLLMRKLFQKPISHDQIEVIIESR